MPKNGNLILVPLPVRRFQSGGSALSSIAASYSFLFAFTATFSSTVLKTVDAQSASAEEDTALFQMSHDVWRACNIIALLQTCSFPRGALSTVNEPSFESLNSKLMIIAASKQS